MVRPSVPLVPCEVPHPFGNLATLGGPMALRPRLATGLLVSRMKRRLLRIVPPQINRIRLLLRASAEPLVTKT